MKLQPVVAGHFYPDSPKKLFALFEDFEKDRPVPVLEGEPEALFLPHAGYVYSGAVAALGYRSLVRPPRTVIVAGPSHYLSFKGVSIFAGEAVSTPLGDVQVDQEVAERLMEADPAIAQIPAAFAREHSVEVHLPMIKAYFPMARVVPIVMGQGVGAAVEPLTRALLGLPRKEGVLFVASSDLSHYPDHGTAVRADREFLDAVLTCDEKKVDEADKRIMGQGLREFYCTHCGKEPVLTLLRYAKGRGALRTRLLEYRNSGDVTGDHDRVVGYGAVAFCR